MTDEELMAAVCRGDQSAYQTLVSQHLKAISHYAFRILGSHSDTEDIAQEVFLKMWVNAAQWQPQKAKLSTWLHRIAHNLCIDFLRKHKRMTTDSEIDDEADSEGSSTSTQESTDQASGDKRMQLLLAELHRLPEAQRSAIMLCHFSGFSNQEAADIMSLSEKALESQLALSLIHI